MTNSPSKPISDTSDEAAPSGKLDAFRRLKQDKLSWLVWLAIGYAGAAIPFFCHVSTLAGAPDAPSWQSGDLHDQIGFVLGAPSSLMLYPMMVYSIVSLSLLLWREERFAGNDVVRFGIFSGLPVAAWYSIALGIIAFDVPALLHPQMLSVFVGWGVGVVTPFVLWAAYRGIVWLQAKLRIPWGAILVLLVVVPLISAAVLSGVGGVVAFPLSVFFLSAVFAPYWCFDAYLAMTLRLLWRYPRPARFTMMQLMAAMSWLAAFLAACRWSVILSLEQYSELPVDPPGGCYIATAASRGHPRFVGSRTIPTHNGASRQVNRQLAVLKAGELALRALAPKLHSRLRAFYDRVGPPIARRLQQPVPADLAYVGLKPVEWGTNLLLISLLGEERHRIDRLYLRDGSPGEQ